MPSNTAGSLEKTARFSPPNSAAEWAYLLARMVLAGIFIYAGATKLMDVRTFAKLMSHYNLVPSGLLAPAAIGLPLLEVIAGIGLIFDVRGSLEVITVLLLMFIFVLWFGVVRELHIDCGCFSADELAEQDGLKQAMYRDGLFLILAGGLFWHRFRKKAAARRLRNEAAAAG